MTKTLDTVWMVCVFCGVGIILTIAVSHLVNLGPLQQSILGNISVSCYRDVRPALFISSIDKGNKTSQFLLQKMPHMIPHKDVSPWDGLNKSV